MSRRSVSVRIAGCPITGTSSCGPNVTANFPRSCSGWPTCTPNVGNARSFAWATGTCIRAGSSRFPSKATDISMAWCGTLSGMRYGPHSSSGGGLEMGKFAAACAGSARRVAGRVAVARTVRLDRASQHAADGGGVGIASPMRPTRESVWQRGLDRTGSRAAWVAIHAPSSWSPAQERFINQLHYVPFPIYAPVPFTHCPSAQGQIPWRQPG